MKMLPSGIDRNAKWKVQAGLRACDRAHVVAPVGQRFLQYVVVADIGDVDIATGIDRNPARGLEDVACPVCNCALGIEAGRERLLQYPAITGIGDVEVVTGIHRHPAGVDQFAGWHRALAAAEVGLRGLCMQGNAQGKHEASGQESVGESGA